MFLKFSIDLIGRCKLKMDFRYLHSAPNRPPEGPLFYTNLRSVLLSRYGGSTSSVIISLERPYDPSGNMYWHTPSLQSSLTGTAKVVRLEDGTPAAKEFREMFPVKEVPSIFLFGPGDVVPSYTVSSAFPLPDTLIAEVASRTPKVAEASPVDETAALVDAYIKERQTRHRVAKPETKPKPQAQPKPALKPEPKAQPKPALKPEPKAQPNPAPKQEPKTQPRADARPQQRARHVGVTLVMPSGQKLVRAFKPDQTTGDVRSWASKALGKSEDVCHLEINGEPVSGYDVPLARYSHEVTFHVVERQHLFQRVRGWVGGMWSSIFGSGHEAPQREAPPPRQAQPERRSHTVRESANITTFKFEDDSDDDLNKYDNGNGTGFQ